MLDQLVEAAPDDQLARVNRGVLLARLGRKAEAVADAEAAANGTPSADVVYRVACIYALLVNDDDKSLQPLAVKWLRSALRAQPSLVGTALSDRDLAPLHQDPDFRRLVAAAYALEQDANSATAPGITH